MVLVVLVADPTISALITTSMKGMTKPPLSRTTRLSLAQRTPLDKPYRFRNAKESDIPQLSKLLVETFNEHTGVENLSSNNWWTMFGSQQRLEREQQKQLRRRWNELILNPGVAHSWIVAELVEPSDGHIVGFMELGTMSYPIPFTAVTTGNPQNESDTTDGSVDSTVGSIWKDIAQKDTKPKESRRERPFLANLAVAKAHRRQGIATTLVQVALKQSRKWRLPSVFEGNNDESRYIFLGVSHDNDSAISLYERLNFTLFLDETDALSTKMLKALTRTPRLYFEKKLE